MIYLTIHPDGSPISKRSFPGIYVMHKGKEIFFQGPQKVCGGNADEELFKCLNTLFDSISDESILDRHWDFLVEAKRIIEPGYFNEKETKEITELRKNTFNYNFINNKLLPIIRNIYENITPDRIKYVAHYGGFTVPPEDLTKITDRGHFPEETTINTEKYVKLANLAFVTQLIFPFLNQYLDHIAVVTGKEGRDGVVGDLVSRVECIKKEEGFDVLDTYLRVSCSRQETFGQTDDVTSELRRLENVVYRGLFNKLCSTFIPSLNKDKNLSKELSSLATSEIRPSGEIRFKSFSDQKPMGEDLSIQEGYGVSQERNGSDELTQAEYFTFGMFEIKEDGTELIKKDNFFKYQCLGLGIKNQYLAEQIYKNLPTSWNYKIFSMHKKLLQLTFMGDVQYGIYDALDYRQLMAASSLAQVKLFEMNFENLAVLVFAHSSKEVPIRVNDESFKLNTREREMLLETCDDYIGQRTGTTENSVVLSINDFLGEVVSQGWKSNIEVGLLGNDKYVEHMTANQTYETELGSEIKKEIIELTLLQNKLEKTE